MSCGKKETKNLALLPKAEIVDIMLHLTLMEEKLEIMRTPKDSAQKIFDYYKSNLLMKKGIDKSDFDDSYNHYLIHDLEGFEEMQAAMIDSLTLYKNTLKTF